MIIQVKVKPNSKENRVIAPAPKLLDEDGGGPGIYIVQVKEPPVEGRANEAVIAALSKHFGVAKTNVTLKRGATSKLKFFEINSE